MMGAKPKVKVIGGSWLGHSKSFSLREDNKNIEPTYFTWTDGASDISTTFYADGGVWRYYDTGGNKRIFMLVEPPSLHPENYQYAKENHELFDYILTYDRQLLDAIPNGLFYPLGGSSIAFEDWGIYPKTKDVCMIVSEKNTMPGHKLRHEIVKQFEGRIDFYGAGFGRPFERKFDVLKDYLYCVVVESNDIERYFTEKIIDPMSVGCFPLYYNFFSVNELHREFYIASFSSLITLQKELDYYKDSYGPHIEILKKNMENAKQYRIAEDWIWEHYPELFK